MAIAATTIWEVRQTGSNTNGGGYNSAAGTTDYSQQDYPQLVFLDGKCTGTTALSSETGGFTAEMVGNVVYLANDSLRYQIATYTNPNQVTIDRNGPSLSALSGYVGGAVAGMGAVGEGIPFTGNVIFIKYSASPYVITTASTNVAGGTFARTGSYHITGYDTTRVVGNLDSNRSTLKINAGVSSAMLFSLGTYGTISNLILDGNNQTSSTATKNTVIFNCKIINFTGTACVTCDAFYCEFSNCATIPMNLGNATFCYAHDNTGAGFTGGHYHGCISSKNTIGFTGSSNTTCSNCVAYGNTQSGFSHTRSHFLANCIAEGNGTYGYMSTIASTKNQSVNCVGYNNLSGDNLYTYTANFSSLPASPFVDAAAGDFTLNDIVGKGLLLKNAGFPSLLTTGTPTYIDINAAHRESSGSTGVTGESWTYLT